MEEKDKRFFDYAWGGFFGLLIGFIVAKVYQTWAIVYRGGDFSIRIEQSPHASDYTPLWIYATEHPFWFMVIVMIAFAGIGKLFVLYLRTRGS